MDVNNSKIPQTEDNPGTGNQKIVSKSFTDWDGMKAFFAYSGLEIMQLRSGSLQIEFLSLQVGDIYFVFSQTNQGIQVVGEDLKEYYSFTIAWLENEQELYSYRHFIDPQRTLFGFNGIGVDLVIPQGGTIADIYIPWKIFNTYIEQLQRYDLDDNFLRRNCVNLLPAGMKEIKDYLKQLVWLAVHKPTFFQQPHIEQLVTDDFLPLLISQIPIKWNSQASLKPSRRSQLIAQAEQRMLANLEEPLTLKQLAQDLESSSSALSYGFQDLFSMSPMRYLKVRRLNAVRQHLKANVPESCYIAAIANRFGFYSTGHFARDYKAMFGELPSETLQKTV